MVLHYQSATRCTLVKHATKIELRWHECYGIDCENAKQIELDRQDLISTCYFHWNLHGELFVLIDRRFFILLDQVSLTSLENTSVRF